MLSETQGEGLRRSDSNENADFTFQHKNPSNQQQLCLENDLFNVNEGDNQNRFQKFQVFKDDCFLTLTFGETQVGLELLLNRQKKMKKYVSRFSLEDKGNQTFSLAFSSTMEVKNFFSNPYNFSVDDEKGYLLLYWSAVAYGFKKDFQTRVKINEVELNEVIELQFQIRYLKNKIQVLEKLFHGPNKRNKLNVEQKKNCVKVQISEESICIYQKDPRQIEQSPAQNIKANKITRKMKRKPRQLSHKRKQESESLQVANVTNVKSRLKSLRSNRKRKSIKKKIKKRSHQESIESFQTEKSEINSQQFKVFDNQIFYKKRVVGDRIRIDYQNGDYYFGQMRGNTYHGKGKYFSKESGQTCECNWVNGQANGEGDIYDQKGNKYHGQIINGERHGKGREEYANRQQYRGDFKHNYRSGRGSYYYMNGDYYEGEWKEDMCHGFGSQVNKDGSIYRGTWVNDEKEGTGVLEKEGQQYIQTWRNGELENQFVKQRKQKKRLRKVEQKKFLN